MYFVAKKTLSLLSSRKILLDYYFEIKNTTIAYNHEIT